MADFQLKEYQQAALQSLSDYYGACLNYGEADTAFYALTKYPYHPVKELPGLPYVCLRLPTGAGKTFIACHALSLTIHEYLQADQGLVLWLVPSNAIREQTLNALRDRAHPYRRALDQALGNVSVIDIGEALYLSRSILDTSTTIIISTIQAFRVDDTEGRKVYETSGALMDHFIGVPGAALEGLEPAPGGGTPKYSLANVLRLRRPIVIVDEAHNARTPLTFDVLARFNPACILELTATPDTEKNPSNVLYQATAAELKAEDMIKLPIMLHTRQDWRELLSDAIAKLNQLDSEARREQAQSREYIRPVMLLQAQPRSQTQETLTIDVVKETLIQDFNIPEDQIARHGQGYKELDDVDIMQPDCPVRFVITVSALKEGWDCPFAYVLCSVAEMRSSTAIEQILGRVMRLPNAARKQSEDLNQAYAFAASNNFIEVAEALVDGLVQNGFEKMEAEKLVKAPVQGGFDFSDLPLFSSLIVPIKTSEMPDLRNLPEDIIVDIQKKLRLTNDGELVLTAHLTEQEKSALKQAFKTEEGKGAVDKAIKELKDQYETRSPAERGEVFSIPVLAFKQGNFLEQFEQTHFLERKWQLSQEDASLTEEEFPTEPSDGKVVVIDINDKKSLQMQFVSTLHHQIQLLASDQGWTSTNLVNWLDRTIPHPDITPSESGAFLIALIQKLTGERGLSLDQLVHDKYRLRQAVSAKIDAHRQANQRMAYQTFLFPDSPLVVSPDLVFTYDPLRYPCKPYRGNYVFRKHYYVDVGTFDSGEERECALYIDTLDAVEYWVRNPARGSKAFWLQTSSDKFYPDFVCKLKDGRYLVVEYKGAHLWADAKEERLLGDLWEKRSEGSCIFVMIKDRNFELIMNHI